MHCFHERTATSRGRGLPNTRHLPLHAAGFQPQEKCMLKWAIIFAIISLVTGLFGFRGISGVAAIIAKFLFAIFLILFLIAVLAVIGVFHIL
jgi:uncharacterized membrane protein YtjA (UPF0391 family)